jgi:hypothetical protein
MARQSGTVQEAGCSRPAPAFAFVLLKQRANAALMKLSKQIFTFLDNPIFQISL